MFQKLQLVLTPNIVCFSQIQYVHLKTYTAGEVVFLQGQTGKHYYMIVAGYCDVYFVNERKLMLDQLDDYDDKMPLHKLGDKVASNGTHVATMKRGTAFGELALFSSDRMRNASVVAGLGDTTEMLILNREHYMKYMMTIHKAAFEMEEKIKSLKNLAAGELFGHWGRNRLVLLSYMVSCSINITFWIN